jgi:uncharacterized protein
MNRPAGDTVPRVEVVVVQPTPFCNIACSYCYLPQRDDRTVIAQSTITNLFGKLFASGWCNSQLTVIWHAGEPLVVPVAFYRAAFAAIEAMRPAGIEVTHAFQTNGMLITPDWCALFADWQVVVGVSIDGPKAMHDARRRTRAGGGTFDRTLAGIRHLQTHDIPFHVISVLSREALDQPDAMHDFYAAEGITQVAFNVEESEGDHVSDMFANADIRDSYRRFLDRFWRRARSVGRIEYVREIDDMIRAVFRPREAAWRNPQVEPLAMLNVDCRGNVSTFSPELLGMKNADYADFLIGNVDTDSFEQMNDSPALAAMLRDIAAGVAACAAGCDYFSVCGGGAPINKLAENGSFASTSTVFCALTQMAPADVVLGSVDDLLVPDREAVARAV